MIPKPFIQIDTSGEIIDYIRSLERFLELESERVREIQYQVSEREKEALLQAQRLDLYKKYIINLADPYKYDKFDKLGEFSLGDGSIVTAYRLCEELIAETQIARDWLKSYEEFARQVEFLRLDELHEKLLMLGKSILGLAIELCPIDTGKLRRSGKLIDLGDKVTIFFDCEYASYVHESMSNYHKVGQAKFLESAAQQLMPNDTVWTEIHGYEGVMITIGLNPDYVQYSHYD